MTNNKTTNTVRFVVDFFNDKIIATRTCFNKASKGVSPYYEELTALIKAHPDYELVVKEPKKKSAKPKNTHDGMDFKFMEEYISIQKNSEILLMEYLSVKAFYKKAKMAIYPKMKKWFLGEFDPDGNGFDVKKAKEEILQAGVDRALLDAHKAKTEEELRRAEMANAVVLDNAS